MISSTMYKWILTIWLLSVLILSDYTTEGSTTACQEWTVYSQTSVASGLCLEYAAIINNVQAAGNFCLINPACVGYVEVPFNGVTFYVMCVNGEDLTNPSNRPTSPTATLHQLNRNCLSSDTTASSHTTEAVGSIDPCVGFTLVDQGGAIPTAMFTDWFPISDYQQCQDACTQNPKCSSYVISLPRDKYCYLYLDGQDLTSALPGGSSFTRNNVVRSYSSCTSDGLTSTAEMTTEESTSKSCSVWTPYSQQNAASGLCMEYVAILSNTQGVENFCLSNPDCVGYVEGPLNGQTFYAVCVNGEDFNNPLNRQENALTTLHQLNRNCLLSDTTASYHTTETVAPLDPCVGFALVDQGGAIPTTIFTDWFPISDYQQCQDACTQNPKCSSYVITLPRNPYCYLYMEGQDLTSTLPGGSSFTRNNVLRNYSSCTSAGLTSTAGMITEADTSSEITTSASLSSLSPSPLLSTLGLLSLSSESTIEPNPTETSAPLPSALSSSSSESLELLSSSSAPVTSEISSSAPATSLSSSSEISSSAPATSLSSSQSSLSSQSSSLSSSSSSSSVSSSLSSSSSSSSSSPSVTLSSSTAQFNQESTTSSTEGSKGISLRDAILMAVGIAAGVVLKAGSVICLLRCCSQPGSIPGPSTARPWNPMPIIINRYISRPARRGPPRGRPISRPRGMATRYYPRNRRWI